MLTRTATSAFVLLGVAALAFGMSACSSTADASDGAAASADPAVSYAVDENTLVFGVVPDSVDTETNYQPLMDYIAQETGKEVEYFESTDYAAMIEAAVAGKVDVASFAGFSYVVAVNNGARITPVSSIIEAKGQEPGYYSQAIVPTGSEITSLADFAGRKVCFVDPSSTSGYLFPSFELLEEGVDVERDVTPVFAGKHDVSVAKVGEGVECEAGFAEDSEVEKSEAVEVVAETMVPGAPLVVSDTLPAELKERLIEVLGEVTIDEILAAGIESADSDGFRSVFYATEPVEDEYYDIIRDICRAIDAPQCQG